jgi:hypothetical protein
LVGYDDGGEVVTAAEEVLEAAAAKEDFGEDEGC